VTSPVRRLAAILLLSLATAPPVRAAEVTPRQRALLALRVLAYDRALPARAGGEVTVAVLYRPDASSSEAERDALLAAFSDLSRTVVVAGRPARAVAVPWRGAADLRGRLEALRASALYACAGLLGEATEIEAAARAGRALTLAGEAAFVERGFAVALVDRGQRAGLVISPAAAAAQGADLDSALLSVAELLPGRAAEPR
jgi:hypothetical protein